MRVSINLFKECLKSTASHFASLSNMEVTYDEVGVAPEVCRTKNFVEAQVVISGERYLLCMPLSEKAHTEAIHVSTLIRGLFSSVLCRYELLRDEMSVYNDRGERREVDVLLHALPKGERLDRFIDYADPEKLIKAIDRLQREFFKMGIAHNNLLAHNIIIDENYTLTPIRYHYLSKGDCTREFNSLREWVNTICCAEMECGEELLDDSLYEEYDYVSNPFEGVVSVCDKSGYKYINRQNEVVIDGGFLWAGDFHEGRAEVQTQEGMGLINREGEYIIPAKYQDLEYNVKSGLTRVKSGEMWGVFNYSGEQILPFEQRYIDDTDLMLLSI